MDTKKQCAARVAIGRAITSAMNNYDVAMFPAYDFISVVAIP